MATAILHNLATDDGDVAPPLPSNETNDERTWRQPPHARANYTDNEVFDLLVDDMLQSDSAVLPEPAGGAAEEAPAGAGASMVPPYLPPSSDERRSRVAGWRRRLQAMAALGILVPDADLAKAGVTREWVESNMEA